MSRNCKYLGKESLMVATQFCKARHEYEHVRKRLREDCSVAEYALMSQDEQRAALAENRFQWVSAETLLSFSGAVRIWLDDVREAPEGYLWCRSVNETIKVIRDCEKNAVAIKELNLDQDLGEYAPDGGDAIRLLDFLAERETFYPVEIHTANPVGRDNMQRMINRYWRAE
ncbi:MAG: hypothetical protein IJ523_09420 [Succinivibrionaceae bacterium]|nr:hypothetical protein [Succinivibrionaceae bacterium]